MKKIFLYILILFATISPAYCQAKQHNIEELPALDGQQQVIDENLNEEKIMQDDTVYFDIENYQKKRDESKVFKLKVEQNDELLKNEHSSQKMELQTKYTQTEMEKTKFNNKTTISAKTMTKAEFLGDKFSFGYGAQMKEYIPIADSTNYSTLTTSLYTQYKLKRLTIEGEFGNNNNIFTEKIYNSVTIGPKVNITKSTSIKGTVTKNFGDDVIFGEVAFVYTPVKSKRNFYVEFDASSSNAQYSIPQQRLQFFGKIKI